MKNDKKNLATVIAAEVETLKNNEKKALRTRVKAGINADCDAVAQ